MSTAKKFLFETSFDEPDHINPARKVKSEEPAEPETPPEPEIPTVTLTEEELAARIAAAEEAAYERGKAEVEEAQQRSVEDEIATALNGISMFLPGLAATLGQQAEMRSGDSIIVAASIARKLLPETMAEAAIEEIDDLIRNTIAELIDEPRIMIRVAPDIADALRERIEPVAESAGFGGKLALIEDPKVPLGDCRLNWSDGGAERDTGRLLAELDEIIDRYRKEQDRKRAELEAAEAEAAESDGGEPADEAEEDALEAESEPV
jgi:flagellar assembly protein FliH